MSATRDRCPADQQQTPVSGPAALPSPEYLMAAFRGQLDDQSPMARWARDLADLWAQLVAATRARHDIGDLESVLCEIAQVVREINSWSVFWLPRPHGARRHTRTFGDEVSHLAGSFAVAFTELMRPAPDHAQLREAWFHLAEARDGYSDLLAATHERQVQLPVVSLPLTIFAAPSA
ncbi:hypothetical protein DFR74_115148 [Nocardia puris]|uniref:Uncharacterized protein n=2 Tax=Nocardia puris TaxID=208602 RepID=A0A366D5J6_9NOCA|nr:hypothetical protein DFR74_115148 [Nocardia puris]